MDNQQTTLTVVEVVESGDGTPNLVVGSDGSNATEMVGQNLKVGDVYHVDAGGIAWAGQADSTTDPVSGETLNPNLSDQQVEQSDMLATILAEAAASAPHPEENCKPPADEAVEAAFAKAPPAGPDVVNVQDLVRQRLQPLYRIEDAIALPEVEQLTSEQAFMYLNSNDPREITAFKDAGRTMLVVLTPEGLAKLAA